MSNFLNYKSYWNESIQKIVRSFLLLFIISLKNQVHKQTEKLYSDRLSLEVMTLNPVCEHVETAQGVPLTVTGVAQVKFLFL